MSNIPNPLPFWKMHGAANDFVLAEVDAPGVTDEEWGALATRICDRHRGVGADGLILVQPSSSADRKMRVFNADGSDGEMCVNGIRCFVKFCYDRGLVTNTSGPTAGQMVVETGPGLMPCVASFDSAGKVDRVRVTAAVPDLDPAASGVKVEQPAPVLDLPVTVRDAQGESEQRVALVSMGNPHAIQFIEIAPEEYPLHRIGPLMERHPMFQYRTNYEVTRVLDRTRMEMRVWERGVGETMACGSGACAVMVAAHVQGLVDDVVDVRLPGGTLQIEWPGNGNVNLTGPAVKVFESEWSE